VTKFSGGISETKSGYKYYKAKAFENIIKLNKYICYTGDNERKLKTTGQESFEGMGENRNLSGYRNQRIGNLWKA